MNYQQLIDSNEEMPYVKQDAFIITTAKTLITNLGSCTSLIGRHPTKIIGFMTHNMRPELTPELLFELQRELKYRYNTRIA